MTFEEELIRRLREIPIETRLRKCGDMVVRMSSEGRPPRTNIPVRWDDEDQYISETCDEARYEIAVLRARVEKLQEEADRRTREVEEAIKVQIDLRARVEELETIISGHELITMRYQQAVARVATLEKKEATYKRAAWMCSVHVLSPHPVDGCAVCRAEAAELERDGVRADAQGQLRAAQVIIDETEKWAKEVEAQRDALRAALEEANRERNQRVESRVLWAPIVVAKDEEWISWDDVRDTRRDAKASWLEGLPEHMQKDALKNVRFARVKTLEFVSAKEIDPVFVNGSQAPKKETNG